MTHILIRGGRLLDAAAHRAEPADILIEGDTIREIGRPGMDGPDGARVIDAAGRLLMPGLINAHTHGHGSLSKGMGDRWSLELLLNAAPWISGKRTLEDAYLAAFLNAVENVRKGCTAAYDLYFEFPLPSPEGMEAVGRAYADVGVRAVIAPMLADRHFYEAIPGLFEAIPEHLRGQAEKLRAAPCEASIAASEALLRGWQFDPSQVRAALAPTIPLHCSDELMVACRDLAREHGVGLHMHLGESKVQAISGLQRYGKTLTAHLDELGFLGPNFTGAHCVWLDDDDIQRLADNGASVAHNPGSNLRLGSGIAPARAMIERKVNLGIGTDGSNCADNQNMFEAMRFAAYASRIRSPDYQSWISSAEAIALATEGSARAMGFGDEIGRIAPGFKADILFLDLSSINFVPLNDVTNQIVNTEEGVSLDSVMIGGRMVLDRGRFTGFDFDKLIRDVEAAVERLNAATAEMKDFTLRLEDYVGGFCVGLGKQHYHIDRWSQG